MRSLRGSRQASEGFSEFVYTMVQLADTQLNCADMPVENPHIGIGAPEQVLTGQLSSLVTPYLSLPKPTFCRVPIHSILGFIIRTYKKVGFGSLR